MMQFLLLPVVVQFDETAETNLISGVREHQSFAVLQPILFALQDVVVTVSVPLVDKNNIMDLDRVHNLPLKVI